MTALADAKAQARALRTALAEQGRTISHSEALELIARQHGVRDWNTLHARLAAQIPDPPRIGQIVTGRYLGQPFRGRILAVAARGAEHTELTIQLDTPVDVVRFDSFSALRSRIRGTIGPDGRSPARTSDGQPQLIVDPT